MSSLDLELRGWWFFSLMRSEIPIYSEYSRKKTLVSFVCTVSERDLWWKGTIHGRLVRLSSNSRESLVGADAAQFADKELIHISRSIFPRRPWGRVNHWPLYPSSAARARASLMTSVTLTQVTLPGRIRYIIRCTRRREMVARAGRGRKEEGWNVSCARGEERERRRGERRRMNSVESRERTIGGSLSPCASCRAVLAYPSWSASRQDKSSASTRAPSKPMSIRYEIPVGTTCRTTWSSGSSTRRNIPRFFIFERKKKVSFRNDINSRDKSYEWSVKFGSGRIVDESFG